jgi:flagellar hook-associated protein 2
MAISALTSSGINSLISTYKETETNNKITPLTTRKTKYQNLSSAYSNLSSRLDSLKSSLATLKATGTDSAFSTKTVSLSNSGYFNVSVDQTAALSSYDIRVNQLAKSDAVVSSTLNSAATNGSSSGTHTLQIKSGDYTSNISVDFGTEPISNQTAMTKIRDAVNSDKAVVTSASLSGNYTGAAGSFDIDLNGTTKTISYSSGQSYSDVIDNIITQLNGTSGILAEKVTDGENVRLQLTVTDSSKYISINRSSDTGELLGASNLNIDVNKEKGASGLVSASVFSPTSDTSKFTLTALNTGYDNRLQITSEDSLTSLGLTSDILTNRYKNSDDGVTTSDTKAGFSFGTQWLKTDLSVDGTAETSGNNYLNSKIEFNGLSVQRNSNTISDLVSGATFSLTSVMKSTDSNVSVSVKNDVSGAKTKIQDFVTKFNSVYSYLKAATSSSDGVRGPLIGDASANSLLNTMSRISYSQVSGIADDKISQLSQIGLSFSSLNGLSISDSSALESAINEKAGQVEALFNSDNGVAAAMYNGISPYTGSSGYLASSKTSADSSVNEISDKITSTQTKIDKSAETLRTRYLDLQEQLVTLLNTQTNFFGTDNSSTLDSMF